jgi:hypothetical protein
LPIAVSVCVFILVRGIENFIVLVGVEAVVERLKLDSDVRDQLRETEACLRSLKADMAKLSTGAKIGSFLPINTHTTLGDSDLGATPRL